MNTNVLSESSRLAGLLQLLLRIFGILCILAVVPLIMPARYLSIVHERLGLGPFPLAPIADYLARSVSALCVFYGGLLLLLATDVQRFGPVIRYQALAIMVLSAFGIIAGARAGLPTIWVAADALGCWIFLVPIYVLSRRIRATP
jgi:hypothetical protein